MTSDLSRHTTAVTQQFLHTVTQLIAASLLQMDAGVPGQVFVLAGRLCSVVGVICGGELPPLIARFISSGCARRPPLVRK